MLVSFVSIPHKGERRTKSVLVCSPAPFQPLNGRLAADLLRTARGRLVLRHSELLRLRELVQVRNKSASWEHINEWRASGREVARSFLEVAPPVLGK